jgi:hypothetical protein
MNNIKKKDLQKGLRMEQILKPIFENKFGQLSYTPHFDNFDYENENVLIELKTRNAVWEQYPSLMFSTAKINKAKKLHEQEHFNKEIYFFWKLNNGLYYWKYNKEEYEINIGGRNDRGINEYQEVVYIKNEYIKNYNDLSFPEGYWKH